MVAKKKKVKKSKSKQIMTMESYAEQLVKGADLAVSNLQTNEGSKISIKGNKFTFKGVDLEEKLQVIILDSVYERSFYDRKYDLDNPCIPACFALSDLETNDTSPSENSVVAQSTNCLDCEHNEWGSADVGKGKKCNSHFRLMVMDGDIVDISEVEELETPFLMVPATSMKAWKSYVTMLAKQFRVPAYAVVTTVTFDKDSDWEKLVFKLGSQISDPSLMGEVIKKREAVYDDCRFEYDPENYVEPPIKSVKSKGKKKTATKKKKKFSK